MEAALEVLEGIEGPGSMLQRAFLLLESGAVQDGIAALQASLGELEPAQATEVLELMLALGKLTPAGARLAASSAAAAQRGDPHRVVELVRAGTELISEADRPVVLALGARAADAAGLSGDALAFRRQIVARHPESTEFPEAACAWQGRSRPGRRAKARPSASLSS